MTSRHDEFLFFGVPTSFPKKATSAAPSSSSDDAVLILVPDGGAVCEHDKSARTENPFAAAAHSPFEKEKAMVFLKIRDHILDGVLLVCV